LSFLELLERSKNVTLDASANQDIPFERLVEELTPTADSVARPLFQVMFSFQSLPRRELELPGIQVSSLPLDNGTAKFDLTLDVNETRHGIECFFEYSTDLFDAATIQRMAVTGRLCCHGARKSRSSTRFADDAARVRAPAIARGMESDQRGVSPRHLLTSIVRSPGGNARPMPPPSSSRGDNSRIANWMSAPINSPTVSAPSA